MSFLKMTVEEYLKTVGSDLPAPGGGSASALCGAQGAGLVTMAAGLTLGRAKYAEFEERCRKVVEQGEGLTRALLEQVDRDAAAFDLVSAAFRLPKATDEEKVCRSAAIQEATLAAARAPMETMSLALEALRNARPLLEGFNTSAASDLGVAALQLLCCVRGAWLNVCINLSSLRDRETAGALQREGEAILRQAEELAHEIGQAVEPLIHGQ